MRVAVAMSGGVDSSTAAAILKLQGHDVIGLTMKLWDKGSRCCDIEDVYDAKRVAAQLKIPHYTLNFKEEFEQKVVNYFVTEYLMGRTPNPCVVCNREIKFRLLLQRAKELGVEYLATGHYAKIEHSQGTKCPKFILKRGKNKDQSYFLGMLLKKSLSNVLFPLGDYTKREVRKIASHLGLKVAEKAESQEVCFIPDGKYAKFIGMRQCSGIAPTRGPIVNKNGDILGYHDGILNYTIGQRRGIGIPRDRPFYVVGIEPKKNIVIVGNEEDLYTNNLIASHPNWIGIEKLENEMEVDVKVRYRHLPAKAEIVPIDTEQVAVQFKDPQKAVTPGQLAVFYRQDMVVGSGWIDSLERRGSNFDEVFSLPR